MKDPLDEGAIPSTSIFFLRRVLTFAAQNESQDASTFL